jgi:hypothetical protein
MIMKTRIILIAYSAVSILGLMLLLSRENIYIVAALILGILLLGHRELWALIKYGRLPVIDEGCARISPAPCAPPVSSFSSPA